MNIDPRINNILCDKDIEADLKRLLLSHKVIEVERVGNQLARIYLDNGVMLEAEGNDNYDSWYNLCELNDCNSAIVDVKVYEDLYNTQFSIFVFADNKQVNLVTYEGRSDGYHDAGFYLTAYLPN